MNYTPLKSREYLTHTLKRISKLHGVRYTRTQLIKREGHESSMLKYCVTKLWRLEDIPYKVIAHELKMYAEQNVRQMVKDYEKAKSKKIWRLIAKETIKELST